MGCLLTRAMILVRCASTEGGVSEFVGFVAFVNLQESLERGTAQMKDQDLKAIATASLTYTSVADGNGPVNTISRRI